MPYWLRWYEKRGGRGGPWDRPLDRLIAAGLLVPAGACLLMRPIFFKHALVQDAGLRHAAARAAPPRASPPASRETLENPIRRGSLRASPELLGASLHRGRAVIEKAAGLWGKGGTAVRLERSAFV